MSLCKHNIISNSTFSWFGAYFNNDIDKLVFYPDIWYKNKNVEALFLNDWIKINTINDYFKYIDIIYYINLDNRQDRNIEFINEMEKINFPKNKINRFSAIYDKHGDIGCSYSHINTLKEFIHSNHNICIIFEDDFEFLFDKYYINNQINYIFENNIEFDIIMLSGNENSVIPTIYNNLNKVIDVQTASSYMINKKFAKILINNFINGSILLSESYKANKPNPNLYAIDMYWKLLQPNNNWFIFNPKLGKQRKSYSSIENKIVDYNC
jgi:glycosyl transferase family 25